LVSIVSSLEASPNCWAELKQENAELTKRVSVMGRKRYKLKSSTSIPTICNEFYF
jgi:hypothetical protein